MLRFGRPLAAAALGLALCGCNATYGGPLREEKRAMTAPHVAASPIHVKTENGGVTITTKSDATEVSINAVVRATTDERLAQTRVTSERLSDGALKIDVHWPGGKPEGSESCSFDITLPDARGVKVRTSNGPIRLSGLGGDATLESSNGSITAHRQAGAVKAATSNGKIEIVAPGGSVIATLSNGAINVKDAPADVSASSSNGGISVRLAPTSPGPVAIDTSNGPATLELGPAFVGTLDLRTSNGRIRADGLPGAVVVSRKDSSATLKFGDKDTASHIRTSNGSVEVRPIK